MSTGKTQSDVLADIDEKLGGILGFLAVRDLKGDVAAMLPRLKDMGLSNKMMALVAGLSENAIAIRMSRMKKTAATKPKAKKKTVNADARATDGDGAASSGVHSE